MKKPLVLLTNDDGIQAPYLREMAAILRTQLKAEVVVVAPERERSAMSHSITLHKPLRIKQVEPQFYSVSGSPVDCVYVGLLKLVGRPPNLVVSGPNSGFNLGTDVFYSGTVGAAIEGGLRGIDSIAVSVERGADKAVVMAADLTCRLAQKLWSDDNARGPQVFNLNVPVECEGRVQWARLGRRFYQDDVHERTDPRGGRYCWIGGGIAGIEETSGTDCTVVVKDKEASVTRLSLDLTADSPSWQL